MYAIRSYYGIIAISLIFATYLTKVLMTKKPLLIFAILLLPLFFYSQNINGRLINKFDKQPVAFAVLFVEETGEWTTSNTDGSFEFKNIQIQSFTIIVKHLGFRNNFV